MKDIQTRGNCPCCGKEQAVMANGCMSQHGYTVDNGWFNGVCSGTRFQPMQVQRAETDHIVAQIRGEVTDLLAEAADIESGKVRLTFVTEGFGKHKVQIAWAEAPIWKQEEAVKVAVWNLRGRAASGRLLADQLEELVNAKLGTPLIIVTKAAAPEQIVSGESRMNGSGREGFKVLTVRRVEGARVYWTSETGRRGWTGTQAFRKLEKVA